MPSASSISTSSTSLRSHSIRCAAGTLGGSAQAADRQWRTAQALMWTAPRVNCQLKQTSRYKVTAAPHGDIAHLDAAGAQAQADPLPCSTASAVAPFADRDPFPNR